MLDRPGSRIESPGRFRKPLKVRTFSVRYHIQLKQNFFRFSGEVSLLLRFLTETTWLESHHVRKPVFHIPRFVQDIPLFDRMTSIAEFLGQLRSVVAAADNN